MNQTKMCEWCHKAFGRTTLRSEAQWARARFCSQPCVYASKRRRVTAACAQCGKTFERRPWATKKTCSRACQGAWVSALLIKPVSCSECGVAVTEEWRRKKQGRCGSVRCRIAARDKRRVARFWRHVEKTDGCWNWTGKLTPQGYGQFTGGGAYRFALELATGPLGDLCALHKCNNKRCVRVGDGHLYRGTYADNFRDMLDAAGIPPYAR